MPRTAAVFSKDKPAGCTISTNSIYNRLHDGDNLVSCELEELCASITQHACYPCSGERQGCVCALVPRLAWLFEKHRDEWCAGLVDVLAVKLHTHLPLLATALLKRGHSARAFRRATEAFDMLVMSVLDPDDSEPGRHLAHLTNSASDSWSTAASSSSSSSSRDRSPTNGNPGGPADNENGPVGRRTAKVETAVHLGKCGLLAELLKEAQQLKQQWGETHKQLLELASKFAPASSDTAAPAFSRELVQQLHAAAAPMREASGLDRSQELYSWATYLITIWPSDILTAPAAAGVVVAAAEVASWHLQSMADIQRVNALLTAQRRRPLPLPRLGGVAAAIELAKCAVEELVTYVPSCSDQPSLLTPLSQQQQQQQQQEGPEVDFPPEVEVMIQNGYQQLLPLCATAIAFDGLQLAWLLDMKQQREQRLQQKLQDSTAAAAAAAAAADGPEGSATAAAAVAAGDRPETDIAATADAAVAVSPRASHTAAAAAPEGDTDETPQHTSPATPNPSARSAAAAAAAAAGASPASPSTGTSTGSQRSHVAGMYAAAAPAAAAKAEQLLLQSARQLYTEVPLWVSVLPGWEQLLKGSWQDMGYPLELQDEVNWAGDDSDSSSSCSDSASTCSSSDEPGNNSNSSSGIASSSVHSHFQQRLGCPFDAAYQYCVDRCVSKWLDNLQLLLYPLRAGSSGEEGAPSASSILASLQDGQFAAAHVAQLPVVLLASAHAALQLNSASRLELVALAANMTGQICRSCEGLSWGISAGSRQQQLPQRQKGNKQQAQQQQQQQGSKDGQGEAIWQVVGLVLQLLQQLLAQATSLQQQQQQQGSKLQAPAAAADSADIQAAVLSCLQLLQYLVQHKLSWDCNSLQHCQRMVYILQLSEASVRYLTAAAVAAADVRLKQQQKKKKKKKKQAADQDQLDKAAAAAHAEAIEPFRATIELVSHNASMTLLKAADGLVHALPRIKRCRLQQQAQLLTQAALSLLLTVSKLPPLVTSAPHCGTVCRAVCAALASLARPDGDMPSRFPRKPQQQHPARLLEPNPAVIALAGRLLVQMGTLLQKQAVEDPVGACTWLSQLLVQEGTLDSEQALAGSSTQASTPDGAQDGLEEVPEQGAGAVSKGYLDQLIRTVLQPAHFEPVSRTLNGMLNSDSSSSAGGSKSSSRGMGGGSSRGDSTTSRPAGGGGGSTGDGSSASPGSTGADRSATIGSTTGDAAGKDVLTRAVRCIKQQTRFWRVELQKYNSRTAQVFAAISGIEQELADADARMAEMRGAVRAVSSHAGANLAAQKRLSIKHMQGVVDGHARRVQEARAALEAVPREFSGQFSAYGELLRTTGLMLAARVPTRFTCNNMSCSSMTTASEAFGLVRWSSCACAGCLGGSKGPAPSFCLAARYCSPACQAAHWQIHKGVCRELRHATRGQQSCGSNPDAQQVQQ